MTARQESGGIVNACLNLGKILGLFLLTASVAHGKVDFSKYTLTAKQIELIERLEKRGFSDAELSKLAQSFERSNTRPAVYVPKHTPADLEAVSAWAEGGAFASFAVDANIKFDRAAYFRDCPNWALFNFGRANATEHLGVDVLWKFTNTLVNLNSALVKRRASFRQEYLEYIRPTEFAKYVDPSEWSM